MSDVLPAQAVGAPLFEFLSWVARSPRTYGDAMAAWPSHCPRFTVWEDALAAGLIEIVGGHVAAIDGATVRLSALGRSALAQKR